MRKIRNIGFGLLCALWVAMVAVGWFVPAKDISESERRPLAQMPTITLESIGNGSFMTKFDSYALDQFPLRNTFRRIKSLFHYNVLNQSDNNGIYIAEGFAVKQEYPLKQASLSHALERFNRLYETYLADTDSDIFLSVIPDKGFYLAQGQGQLKMDYDALFAAMQEGMPWANYVDITDTLTGEDYYRTDTHWRQEMLRETSDRLCEALGVTPFEWQALTRETVERPFYGVYYGQAALPMEPEELTVLRNPVLDNCTVYDHETGKTGSIYDMTKLDSPDLYDVYLSGARALLTVTNPAASSDRELIVFRDSFGSSLIPLLIKDYATVTVVDIRYIASDLLGNFVDFRGQDVLFLYSVPVLNASNALK